MNSIALAKPLPLNAPETPAPARSLVKIWDLWWVALAATLIPVSLFWDFSWESTIGVDRFWSPPHLATHLGVWLNGILGARLVMLFTLDRHWGFGSAGVSIRRLSAPSGAWVLLWSAVMLQVVFLLDNWWQRAYGVGAGLWAPPQILKAAGFFGILLGGLMLCAGARRADSTGTATRVLIWQGGLFVALCSLVLTMSSYTNMQHTASFSKISCAIYPALLLAVTRTSESRWAATRSALCYTSVVCSLVWLLPLFPARPLTAPIHNPTDHMMPPPFPLMLAAPALVMDWLKDRFSVAGQGRSEIWQAVILGLGFCAVFVPVQWIFAQFLLSSAADNWVFAGGGRHWPFFLKIDQARVMFWGMKRDPLTWQAALLAGLLAIASAWTGLRVARRLEGLRR